MVGVVTAAAYTQTKLPAADYTTRVVLSPRELCWQNTNTLQVDQLYVQGA